MFNIFGSKNAGIDDILQEELKDGYKNPVSIKPKRDEVQSSYCRSTDLVGPRLVGLAVKILQIGEFDLKSHTFFAETELYLDWIPTMEEVLDYVEGREMDFDPPDAIKCKNAVDLEYRKPWTAKKLYYMERWKKYFVRCHTRVSGRWRENYELKNFPVDIQDATMTLNIGTSTRGADHWILIPTRCRKTAFKLDLRTSAIQDYAVGNIFLCFDVNDPSSSSVGLSKSHVHLVVKLVRRWEPYCYRMLAVIAMVSFCTLGVFLISVDDYQDRLAHCATMLLTAVAFQFVTSNSLPVIPYLTFMDVFVNLQFAFIFFVGVLFSVRSGDDKEDFDDVVRYVALGVWFFLQIVMIIDGWRRRKNENAKLTTVQPNSQERTKSRSLSPEDGRFVVFTNGALDGGVNRGKQ